ncbi:MAG: prepilin-type N-terminal cleavage/methylation domain-containing protein, partial [Halioglobus sp.]|nr:prepilin-type N-terminal cleavage/methylation domain-containing protein [Halioglobus sp.]
MRGQRSINSGFTLIEVMIVVVIVAALALVAYPAYQNSIAKANRAEAQSYLMQLAQRQQQFFNDARVYADSSVALNVEEPERVATNYVVSFELSTNMPPAFLITA